MADAAPVVPQPIGPVHIPAENMAAVDACVISNPHWAHTILLGFQQFLLTLGTTTITARYLVPLMGGIDGDIARVIQLLLFMSAVNTIFQTWLGTRLPTVMGPSLVFFAAVLVTIDDMTKPGFTSDAERFKHTMRAVQGSIIVSSTVPIVLGYSGLWGKLTRYFSPLVVVSMCSVGGLGLFQRGFPMLAGCLQIGIPALVLVIVSQYLKRVHQLARSVFGKYSVLISVGISWALAAVLTASGVYDKNSQTTQQSCRTDTAHLISAAPWVKIPYPFQYGLPIFRASSVFGMMGPSLVSAIESTGILYAASRLAGATLPPAHVISRSIGLQGIGQLLSGMFGAPVGTTISAENVGLVGLTSIGSRRVVQVSAAFMLFFSIFGKFVAFFASIPPPIFGALYCILFGLVSACGLSFTQFVNTNSMRNMFVLGVSLFLGISIPHYFALNDSAAPIKTDAGWFNTITNTLLASSPAIALVISTFIDHTYEPQDVASRGIPWWTPFQSRNGDRRTRDFYDFPPIFNGLGRIFG